MTTIGCDLWCEPILTAFTEITSGVVFTGLQGNVKHGEMCKGCGMIHSETLRKALLNNIICHSSVNLVQVTSVA